MLSEGLIVRDSASGKFDLDSDQGQANCRQFLAALERFFLVLQLRTAARAYRDRFSKAYKVLY